MNFNKFKLAVTEQFVKMEGHTLYKVDVSKDDMWDTYINSFPKGSNPIFRERTVHDCQCCKQFIRKMGNVVAFIEGERVSIWDCEIEPKETAFVAVADAMGELMAHPPIRGHFLHYEDYVGTDHNNGVDPNGEVETWEHFHLHLPATCIANKDQIPTLIGKARTTKEVFQRALTDISMDALNTVLELIGQNSLYRGEEHKRTIEKFRTHKIAFNAMEGEYSQEIFCWECAKATESAVTRIRNTSIGTLLVDLSEGKTLDAAVGAFEAMVAPSNYKRPKALITPTMIKKAQEKVEELGFTDALERRHAVLTDITVNNVLYVSRKAKDVLAGGVFDVLMDQQTIDPKKLSKVEEVDVATFVADILPQAETIEILMENRLVGNLMSLVAPVHADANNMLMWKNNFSWSYNGEMADSMKELVKAAGGKIDGVMRFSIQWNDSDVHNNNDFDAWCFEPGGNKIYYMNTINHHTTGNLDVDITHTTRGKPAVENITWTRESKMEQGLYSFCLHNYSSARSPEGFSAEFECNGEIRNYHYPKPLSGKETVAVLEGNFKNGEFHVTKELPSSVSSKEVWGIQTMQFHNVNLIMNSPNHWDGEKTGNRHLFFILDGCKQEGNVRGFYNEFLTPELREHRKVFEMVGSKTLVAESDEQLSGIGISSTQRGHLYCKVTGSFSRTIKISF